MIESYVDISDKDVVWAKCNGVPLCNVVREAAGPYVEVLEIVRLPDGRHYRVYFQAPEFW